MPAFYLSSLLAFTGGHMVNYAVILYLQEKVGSDLLSGIGFGLSFGTSILFGWFAGVLCDRISPTRVIHAAQALFVLCLAGLWWTDAGASDTTRGPAALQDKTVLVLNLRGPLVEQYSGNWRDAARCRLRHLSTRLRTLAGVP